MTLTVLVTGASGFVGSRLVPRLLERGHRVRAMTRRPEQYTGEGEPVAGDVMDPDSLRQAMAGVDIAYYLVHSLSSDDFVARDAAAARNFTAAAAEAGVERIVYLGGLGADGDALSDHLRSRREVERILSAGSVPVTTLRAAVIIGHGGISWEITRQLVDHLPALITPQWVATRTQPVALPDVLRYLTAAGESPEASGRTYEVGGPDVLSFADMLQRVARLRGKFLPNVTVPLLTPRLSSMWLSLVTDVDMSTARNLVDSLSAETIVREHPVSELDPAPALTYEDSVRLALAEREAEVTGQEAERTKHEAELAAGKAREARARAEELRRELGVPA
ncbi:NAD(P)H-binding protein [Dactylosporangium vinaceum]|uniref:NAD(P)H-binding protein n=1 Tax=Dactylosporangium vinaceum TaxID=53362 RepID=A0ABV5M9V8_9ACTN|nr:NAD(P)H-binding protein [Dactylosporangium vinaceum]